MKYDLLTIVILGYGVSFIYRKSNRNPKNKNNNNDGSIKKYRIYKPYFSEYSNPCFGVRINYDYTFMIKIHIGNE